jgi:hypothetical protein
LHPDTVAKTALSENSRAFSSSRRHKYLEA